MKITIFKTIFITCMLSMLTAAVTHARDVTLQWDANTDAATGYKIYYNADSPGPPYSGAGSLQGPSPVNSGNQTTATLSGLDPARSYYFAVTAYDASGAESSYSNIVSAPETTPPTVSISAPAPNSTVSGTTTVSVSAVDDSGVTKVEYFVDGSLAATDTASPYSFGWNTSLVAVGPHTLMAKAYDAAGNVGQSAAVSVTVANDATAPSVSITSPANGSSVSGAITVNITATDNLGVAKVELYLNGTLYASYGSAPYNISWNTTSVTNGSYTLTARAYDAAGNVGQSPAITITVNNQAGDATPPTVAIIEPGNSWIMDGTITYSASATDNVGVTKLEFYVDGTLKATYAASSYLYRWDTTQVANGSHTLTVKAYDAAGNVGQSSAVTITVNNPVADATPPTVAISSPTSKYIYGSSVNISASASDNVAITKMELYIDGALKMTTSAKSFNWTWYTASYAKGTHLIKVKAYDAANNVGKTSKSVTMR